MHLRSPRCLGLLPPPCPLSGANGCCVTTADLRKRHAEISEEPEPGLQASPSAPAPLTCGVAFRSGLLSAPCPHEPSYPSAHARLVLRPAPAGSTAALIGGVGRALPAARAGPGSHGEAAAMRSASWPNSLVVMVCPNW